MTLQVLAGASLGSLNDVTAYTDIKSVLIKESGYSGVATCDLRLIHPSVTPLAEWALRIMDGGSKAFEGKIKNPQRSDSGLGPIASVKKYYDINAQDNSSYLTDDVIDDSAGLRTTAETDAARIVWLISTYSRFLTAALVAGGGFVQQVQSGNLPTQDFRYMNLWEAIEEVQKLTGGRFYVDYDAKVHYFSAETANAPFDLSDTPNGSTTFGYRDLTLPSESYELTNAVLVVGGEGTTPVWRPDPSTWPTASHTAYGRREGVLRLPDEGVQANLQSAGDAFITAYGSPAGPVKLRLYRPALRAGMNIGVTNALWGMSDVRYPIVEWQAKPVLDDRQLEYTLTLGSREIDLASIISAQGAAIGAVGASVVGAYVGDTTAPATPTGLTLSSTTRTDADGNAYPVLGATWNANSEPDLEAYELQLARAIEGSITFSASASGSGGSLPAGAYNVAITGIGEDGGETAAFGDTDVTLTAGQRLYVNITAKTGCSSYKVYASRSGQDPPLANGQTINTTGSNVEITPEGTGATPPSTSTAVSFDVPATYRTPFTGITIEDVQGATFYAARLRAVDRSGNASAYGTIQTATTAKDDVPPAIPTGLSAVGGYRLVGLTWAKNTEADLARYEVRWSEDEVEWTVLSSLTNIIVIQGLAPDVLHYFEVRAIDRSNNVDDGAGNAVDAGTNPDSGWTTAQTATPTLIGAADVAFNSVLTAILSANQIDASTITTGTLSVGGSGGYTDYILIFNSTGQEIGRWDADGLLIKDPGNTDRQMRFLNGVLQFSSDAGTTWSTAISPEGIDASKITFGAIPGGHNSVPNSSFELSAFTTTLSKVWTSAADWGTTIGTDVNIDKSGTELKLTAYTY